MLSRVIDKADVFKTDNVFSTHIDEDVYVTDIQTYLMFINMLML